MVDVGRPAPKDWGDQPQTPAPVRTRCRLADVADQSAQAGGGRGCCRGWTWPSCCWRRWGVRGRFHLGGLRGQQAGRLDVSVAACQTSQALNIGYAQVTKPGIAALERPRLSHVAQNYLSAETFSTANAPSSTPRPTSVSPSSSAAA
ncbi:hypothetical protein E1287_21810 [Actinomadura sp. KC06]|nr:hypothetical protein E1287_21810 [Actinomadura sp. KC06]